MPERGRYIEWTPELDRRLISLFAVKSARLVGLDIGCSENTVYLRAMKLGIRKTGGRANTWTEEQDAELLRLYPDHSQDEIARIMGRSKTAIRMRIYLTGAATLTKEPAAPEQKQDVVTHIEPRICEEVDLGNGTRRIRFIDHNHHSHALKNRRPPPGMSSLGYV